MGLGIRGWRRVGLGLCKVGGVGPRSNPTPPGFCSEDHLPRPAHVVCLPHLSHLIQLISSLVQTARPAVAVSDIERHTTCVVLGVLHGELCEPLD